MAISFDEAKKQYEEKIAQEKRYLLAKTLCALKEVSELIDKAMVENKGNSPVSINIYSDQLAWVEEHQYSMGDCERIHKYLNADSIQLLCEQYLEHDVKIIASYVGAGPKRWFREQELAYWMITAERIN